MRFRGRVEGEWIDFDQILEDVKTLKEIVDTDDTDRYDELKEIYWGWTNDERLVAQEQLNDRVPGLGRKLYKSLIRDIAEGEHDGDE